MKVVIKYSFVAWIAFYALVVLLLSQAGKLESSMLRVGLFILPQIIIFYINLLVLLPNYLEKQRKTAYFLALLALVVFMVTCFGFLDIYLDRFLPLEFGHLKNRPQLFIFTARFMSLAPPVIIGALIRKSILLQQKTKESFVLQNKMLEAETNALKAQINPHFLFNTLNNIYSLSQFDNKKTGDAILQLSDILRYVTYDGNEKLVSLSAELDHINSFIKLQLLRDEDDSNIEVDIAVDNQNLQISPLLLIPFVENSFKHGNHYDKEKGWVKIRIKNQDKLLILEVSNSVSAHPEKSQKDKVGGVGMENVKKRLSLLYPGKHDLVLKMDKFSYTSTLKIHLI